MLATHEPESVAKMLGSNVESHEYAIVAGRLVLQRIYQQASKNLIEYVARLGARLKPELIQFIFEHKDSIRSCLDRGTRIRFEIELHGCEEIL